MNASFQGYTWGGYNDRGCIALDGLLNDADCFAISCINSCRWGDAKCTHTKREILRNRLLAVLLTKLSYNFHLVEQQQQQKAAVKLFTVDYKGTLCRYPDEFVAALLDHGHTIEVCPRSTITTFGIAACVKEDNDSWTNIPIAFFFRTGYERRDGRPAYFSAPHGGLDLSITSGPLLGKEGTKCDIQFYVAIEGLCGWHSNHNADVPWVRAVSTTEIYDRNQTLQAVRMAGLLAVTFNSLATKVSGSEQNVILRSIRCFISDFAFATFLLPIDESSVRRLRSVRGL